MTCKRERVRVRDKDVICRCVVRRDKQLDNQSVALRSKEDGRRKREGGVIQDSKCE